MDKVLASQEQEKQSRPIFSIERPLRTKQGVSKQLAPIPSQFDDLSVSQGLIGVCYGIKRVAPDGF